MKQFFVPLFTAPGADSSDLVANVVDIARHNGGTIYACVFEIDVRYHADNFVSIPELDANARQAELWSQERGIRIMEALRLAADRAGVGLEADHQKIVPSLLGEAVMQRARYFDLTMLQQSAISKPAIEATLLGSGRPLLIIPQTQRCGRFEHFAIGWDGGRAASRALADALWILEGSTRTTVLTAPDETRVNYFTLPDICDLLRKRGFNAERAELRADPKRLGAWLQQSAIDYGADILVVGGFGHSRLREFVLGGVTQEILSDPKLPLLMSH